MRPQTVPPRLVEIISPRGQAPGIAAVESLLGSVGFQETFSLEMAATESARWFLARAGNEQHLDDLESQLRASYPQSDLRHLDTAAFPSLDPTRLGQGEQVVACALGLRGPGYLPLRTFEDGHAYGSRASETDPNRRHSRRIRSDPGRLASRESAGHAAGATGLEQGVPATGAGASVRSRARQLVGWIRPSRPYSCWAAQ